MQFFIIYDDAESEEATFEYFAELEDGVAKIYRVDDGERNLTDVQPWYPAGDGSRQDWTDLDQVVAWFKQTVGV